MTGKTRVFRKVLLGCGGCFLILVVALGFYLGPTLKSLYKAGFFDKRQNRTYQADLKKNLTALRVAMMLYHDSEGAFPVSSHWMDAIKDRIRPDDLSKEEADKKLVDPIYAGQAGKYGFAMNDVTSSKYKDDIKNPNTILIFESSDTQWNAHGDPAHMKPQPAHPGGNFAITVNGQIVPLP